MSFFLWLFNKPIAVLYGLVFACITGMFVQYVLVYNIMNRRFSIGQPLLMMTPALLTSIFIVSDYQMIRWAALILLMPALYFIYIKNNRTKFKLLVHS